MHRGPGISSSSSPSLFLYIVLNFKYVYTGPVLQEAFALWRSMGKTVTVRPAPWTTQSFATSLPEVFTSRWNNQVVAPLAIKQTKDITIKQFLGKDSNEISTASMSTGGGV
jgi:hypothetical protein